MSTERKHHPFSPSQLQALEACPSYQTVGLYNEKARLGTLQHTAAETGEDNDEFSDEQAAAVSAAILFVNTQRTILEEEAARVNGGKILDLSEVYLPVDAEETTGGYADSLLISHDRKRAVLTDFKFGQWAAEPAANNLQGIAYSLGAFFKFPTLEEVDVHFFQPALNVAVNSVNWNREDVPEMLLRVKTVVARAKLARSQGTFQTVNPTVPGCLFCANLAVCPAVMSLVLRVGHKFHAVDVPNDITPSVVLDAKNSTMGMRLSSLVSAWAYAFRSLTTDRVLRGAAPVPEGYIIAQSAGKRKILDAGKFKDAALTYLTKEVYDTTVEPQLGKVETAIKDTAPRGMKDNTVKEFKALLLESGAVKAGEKYPCLKAKTSEDSEAADGKE